MTNRSIEIPEQVRRLESAYTMRNRSVLEILKKNGVTEASLVNYILGSIEEAVSKGDFSVVFTKNEGNLVSKVMFENFQHYMILTRRFRQNGYTVTPAYANDGERQYMSRLTISWNNAIDKL
ncbi:hypothetical protein PHIREBALL_223 [Bacillus phage Phireball]|uniref:Uncharacterized protein n=1 Tax=Bacillus phage SageFayge TaxID=1805954 RepID=A0A143FN06_9CAUD|nr:hypothetical protein SAGEFAYGE_221 [Bacillus phage SageFayge]AMW63141.1 hypothetical protein SAGEFAYGE_221 [Bacillus phage SageFayge]QDH49497.1 hypothetical protein PHIREBALL_223 [Bacillus phage Phireball]